jgi:hypothetical protein
MVAGIPPMTSAKFVLRQAVLPAYEAVLGDFVRFFRRAGLPLAGLFACAVLVVIVQPYAPNRTDTLTGGACFFEFAVLSVFAFSWHRMLVGATAGSHRTWDGLRFFGYCVLMLLFFRALLNGFAWVFVLGGAFIVLTGSLAPLGRLPRAMAAIAGRPLGALLSIFVIVVFAAHIHAGVPNAVVQFLDRGLYVVALMPIARLLLALPAVSMGRRGDVVAAVWRQSRGRGAALFTGLLVCFLPFGGAVWFVEEMLGLPVWDIRIVDDAHPIVPQPFGTPELIASWVEALVILLGTAVLIGYLSLAYRQLGGEPAPSDASTDDDVLATG